MSPAPLFWLTVSCLPLPPPNCPCSLGPCSELGQTDRSAFNETRMAQVPNPGLFTEGAGTAQMRNNHFCLGEGREEVGCGPAPRSCRRRRPPSASLGEEREPVKSG